MYSIFHIDPPWPKRKGGLRKSRPNQGIKLDYKTMSVEDIFELLDIEVFNLAQTQHSVFMWTIDQFLSDCELKMMERGYKRHARLIWDKQNGVAPCFSVRYSHEYVIWWYKPKFTPVALETRGKYTTVFSEKPREHSRKPDIFYDMINSWFPNESKIDVFSREPRTGWDQFGDQTSYFK